MTIYEETSKETPAAKDDDKTIHVFDDIVTMQKGIEDRLASELEDLHAKLDMGVGALEYRLTSELAKALENQKTLEYNLKLESKLNEDRFAQVYAVLDFYTKKRQQQGPTNSEMPEPSFGPQTQDWRPVARLEEAISPERSPSLGMEEGMLNKDVSVVVPDSVVGVPDFDPEQDPDGRVEAVSKGSFIESTTTSQYGQQMSTLPKDLGVRANGTADLLIGIRELHSRMATKVDALERALLRWRLLDSANELQDALTPNFLSSALQESDSASRHYYDEESRRNMSLFTPTEQVVMNQFKSSSCFLRYFMMRLEPESSNERQRRRLQLIYFVLILLSCIVAFSIAMLDEITGGVIVTTFAKFTSETDATYTEEEAETWMVVGVIIPCSVLWSIVELLLLYAMGMLAAVPIARVRNLTLVPLNCDRAEILKGILRVAAQADFTSEEKKGVNPLKGINGILHESLGWSIANLFTNKAIRVVLKIFRSPAQRRVLLMLLTRTTVKNVSTGDEAAGGSHTLLFLSIGLNMCFDVLNMHFRFSSIQLCCRGPKYISTVLEDLFHAHKKASGIVDMNYKLKITCCRAVAMAALANKQWHPNISYALNCIETLITDDVMHQALEFMSMCADDNVVAQAFFVQQSTNARKSFRRTSTEDAKTRHAQLLPLGIDDAECFLSELKVLDAVDADLVLALLAFALTLDGTVTKNDLKLMRLSLITAQPPGVFRNSSPGFLFLLADTIFYDRVASAEQILGFVRDPGPDVGDHSSCSCM